MRQGAPLRIELVEALELPRTVQAEPVEAGALSPPVQAEPVEALELPHPFGLSLSKPVFEVETACLC